MIFFRSYKPQIIGALICLTLGTASGYGVKAGNFEWYNGLIKPFFTPPSWVFGPIWTFLYILEGIVLGKLWNIRKEAKKLLYFFTTQFLLSLIWPFLFFYCQRIDLSLINLIAIWLNFLLFMILASRYRWTFVFLLPYAFWVSFALVLNFSILLLNLT